MYHSNFFYNYSIEIEPKTAHYITLYNLLYNLFEIFAIQKLCLTNHLIILNKFDTMYLGEMNG